MSSYFCEFLCFPCELLKSRPRLTETIVSHGQKVLFHTEITENTEIGTPFNLFNPARRAMSSYFCEFLCFPCELLKSRPRLTETIVSHGQKVLFHTEITENTEIGTPFNLFNPARRAMSSYFCEFLCFPCELLKSRPRLTETIVSHGQKVLFHTEITENTEIGAPFNLFNPARRAMFLNKDIKDVKDIRDIRAIGIRRAKGSCSKKHIPSG